MKYHYTTIRIAKIKIVAIANADEDMRKLNHIHCQDVKCQTLCKIAGSFLYFLFTTYFFMDMLDLHYCTRAQ